MSDQAEFRTNNDAIKNNQRRLGTGKARTSLEPQMIFDYYYYFTAYSIFPVRPSDGRLL